MNNNFYKFVKVSDYEKQHLALKYDEKDAKEIAEAAVAAAARWS